MDDSWCTLPPAVPAATPRHPKLRVAAKHVFANLPSILQDLLRVTRQHLSQKPELPAGIPAGPPVVPTPQDRFLSIGLDWDYGLDSIATLKRKTGVPVILGCYDTIPVDYPEISSRATREFFRDYFVRVARLADRIFAISETTRLDLERLYLRLGVSDSPPVVAVPLGCHEPRVPRGLVDDQDIPTTEQGFVLYVSTIEARKNHRVLVQVWSDLYRRYGRDIPTLVLVGMPGWGVHDLLEELQHMGVFRDGLIRVLHHASDDLLALLYRRCLFAVFPSVYEGWGLGAVEAMSYGKVCVISEAPALVEATQGLCPTIHPFDFLGWRAAVIRYWRSPREREAAEAKIQSSFRMRTWQEFGRDFEAFLARA